MYTIQEKVFYKTVNCSKYSESCKNYEIFDVDIIIMNVVIISKENNFCKFYNNNH